MIPDEKDKIIKELMKLNKRSLMLNRNILRKWKHYMYLDLLFIIVYFLCGIVLGVMI